MNLDDLFEQKNDVAKAVLQELEKVMADYGYSIEQRKGRTAPDAAVPKAMNDIMPFLYIPKASAGKCLQRRSREDSYGEESRGDVPFWPRAHLPHRPMAIGIVSTPGAGRPRHPRLLAPRRDARLSLTACASACARLLLCPCPPSCPISK